MIDEIKLDLLSLENEINKLDENLRKNIDRDLHFLRSDIDSLSEDIDDLKEAWDMIDDDYKKLKENMERF